MTPTSLAVGFSDCADAVNAVPSTSVAVTSATTPTHASGASSRFPPLASRRERDFHYNEYHVSRETGAPDVRSRRSTLTPSRNRDYRPASARADGGRVDERCVNGEGRLLADYVEGEDNIDPVVALRALQLMFDEFATRPASVERPMEVVVRAVQGTSNGSFRRGAQRVLRARRGGLRGDFRALRVGERRARWRGYVEELAGRCRASRWRRPRPCRRVGVRTEQRLDGGRADRWPRWPEHDGRTSVGIAYEQSLIGQEYLRTAPASRVSTPGRGHGEVAIPQVGGRAPGRPWRSSQHRASPTAMFHVGFGLGLLGMNEGALEAIGWDPPRYTTTAFGFRAQAATSG